MPAITALGSKAKKLHVSINLMPKDPFFSSPVGKLLRWSLSVGRYIVIFTELIVILSFITRFTLDRQVTDLNESINQKKVIIESFGSIEQEIRTFQAKTTAYGQIRQEANLADAFPLLSRILPRDVKLKELSITGATVSLSGVANSQDSFNTLITNLNLTPEFIEITVGSVGRSEDEEEPGISFTISAVKRLEEVAPAALENTTNVGEPTLSDPALAQ